MSSFRLHLGRSLFALQAAGLGALAALAASVTLAHAPAAQVCWVRDPDSGQQVALADVEQGLARIESRQVFGKVIVHF